MEGSMLAALIRIKAIPEILQYGMNIRDTLCNVGAAFPSGSPMQGTAGKTQRT
jgi:hypothetical protein